VRIVICINTDLSRSKTLCGKFFEQDLLASIFTDFLPHPPSLRLFGPRVLRALWSRLQPGFTPRVTSRSRTFASGPGPTRARVALSVSNGFACSSPPGPASRRAQVALTIHTASEGLLEFASAGSLPYVPGP